MYVFLDFSQLKTIIPKVNSGFARVCLQGPALACGILSPRSIGEAEKDYFLIFFILTPSNLG